MWSSDQNEKKSNNTKSQNFRLKVCSGISVKTKLPLIVDSRFLVYSMVKSISKSFMSLSCCTHKRRFMVSCWPKMLKPGRSCTESWSRIMTFWKIEALLKYLANYLVISFKGQRNVSNCEIVMILNNNHIRENVRRSQIRLAPVEQDTDSFAIEND